MDEKTLQAVCAQLAELQLQITALLTLLEIQPLPNNFQERYRKLLDGLSKAEGRATREFIRDGIRQGILIQDMHDMGQGHLWNIEESPDNPKPD